MRHLACVSPATTPHPVNYYCERFTPSLLSFTTFFFRFKRLLLLTVSSRVLRHTYVSSSSPLPNIVSSRNSVTVFGFSISLFLSDVILRIYCCCYFYYIFSVPPNVVCMLFIMKNSYAYIYISRKKLVYNTLTRATVENLVNKILNTSWQNKKKTLKKGSAVIINNVLYQYYTFYIFYLFFLSLKRTVEYIGFPMMCAFIFMFFSVIYLCLFLWQCFKWST